MRHDDALFKVGRRYTSDADDDEEDGAGGRKVRRLPRIVNLDIV